MVICSNTSYFMRPVDHCMDFSNTVLPYTVIHIIAWGLYIIAWIFAVLQGIEQYLTLFFFLHYQFWTNWISSTYHQFFCEIKRKCIYHYTALSNLIYELSSTFFKEKLIFITKPIKNRNWLSNRLNYYDCNF